MSQFKWKKAFNIPFKYSRLLTVDCFKEGVEQKVLAFQFIRLMSTSNFHSFPTLAELWQRRQRYTGTLFCSNALLAIWLCSLMDLFICFSWIVKCFFASRAEWKHEGWVWCHPTCHRIWLQLFLEHKFQMFWLASCWTKLKIHAKTRQSHANDSCN